MSIRNSNVGKYRAPISTARIITVLLSSFITYSLCSDTLYITVLYIITVKPAPTPSDCSLFCTSLPNRCQPRARLQVCLPGRRAACKLCRPPVFHGSLCESHTMFQLHLRLLFMGKTC